MSILRSTLQEQVRQTLLDWIHSGHLAPGQRLTEENLSRSLSVSRTPVREALRALEGDGLVRSEPNRGFTLVRPNEEMVREVYPILSALECLGLRLGAARFLLAADRLEALNHGMQAAELPARRYELDAEFHRLLAGSHANRSLEQELARLRLRVRYYDGAWERGLADLAGSCREHAAIVTALRGGDIAAAEQVLAAHWERGIEVVCAWLRTHNERTSS